MRTRIAGSGVEHWFAATLLFASKVGGTPSLRPLVEERIVLFQGRNTDAVKVAAMRYGRAEEHSYENAHGERVEWRFIGLEQLDELDVGTPKQGWEVASRFTRRSLRALRRHT